MMFIVILFILLWILYVIYERYVPVRGIPTVDIKTQLLGRNLVLLDVRDYNISAKGRVEGVEHLPYAYIKRYYQEIKGRDIVLVVSDQILLNMSARFLRRRRFNIIGYYKVECYTTPSRISVYRNNLLEEQE